MNDQPITHRFRSAEYAGEITVDSQSVHFQLRKGLTHWESKVPLETLSPYLTRTQKISFAFWCFLVVAVIAFTMCLVGMVDDLAEFYGGAWYYVATGTIAAVMLVLAIRFRREEWVTFPSKISVLGIWYCRGGPDRESFDAFTEELARRIEDSHEGTSSNTPSAT